MLSRRAVIAGVTGAGLVLAGRAGASEFYPVPVELITNLERLQGAVTIGARSPDVRLYEFFDYNCPWCRRTAGDARALVTANKDLAVTLVNYAVLGIPSISASRVALAVSRQRADRYLAFHEAMFARRGVLDGETALAVAAGLGLDKAKLLADADSDAVTAALRASAQLGASLGFQATPSYLLGREGFTGGMDRKAKQQAIDAWRRCDATRCG